MTFKYIIISIGLLSLMIICRTAGKSKFNVKLVSMTKCEQSTNEWDPESPMSTELSVKKFSREIVKFNMTYIVNKTFGPVELLARAYQVRLNSVKDLLFKMEHVDCRSHLAVTVRNLFKMHFDNKCFIKAGVYVVKNLDFNSLKWIMKQTFTSSGRYSYELEFSHANGATSCISVVCDATV